MFSDHNEIKLETINKSGKITNLWILKSRVLNSQWIEERRENRKNFEINENENTTYQNFWGAVKAMPKGNFISLNDYF